MSSVVTGVRERGYKLEMKPGAYVTYAQVLTSWFPESLVARTRTKRPADLAPALHRVIAEVLVAAAPHTVLVTVAHRLAPPLFLNTSRRRRSHES